MDIITLNKLDEYDDFTVREVWKKAKPYKRFELYKLDYYGTVMFYDHYMLMTPYGWIIEQIKFPCESKIEIIESLRAVNWKNYDKGII